MVAKIVHLTCCGNRWCPPKISITYKWLCIPPFHPLAKGGCSKVRGPLSHVVSGWGGGSPGRSRSSPCCRPPAGTARYWWKRAAPPQWSPLGRTDRSPPAGRSVQWTLTSVWIQWEYGLYPVQIIDVTCRSLFHIPAKQVCKSLTKTSWRELLTTKREVKYMAGFKLCFWIAELRSAIPWTRKLSDWLIESVFCKKLTLSYPVEFTILFDIKSNIKTLMISNQSKIVFISKHYGIALLL